MPELPLDRLDAVVFDTDGVLTDTARVHAAAWARLFNDYLERRAARHGERFRPFTEADYLRHVDGRPRYDGVAAFLASRAIVLPWGDPADPPDRETVCGLGNAKDRQFAAYLRQHGAQAFPASADLVARLRTAGLRTAVVSASRNMRGVLASAGLPGLFDAEIDGIDAARLELPGKPDPALFLEAARRLGVAPGRAAVVEDALAGVEAGRRGGFALVIGATAATRPPPWPSTGRHRGRRPRRADRPRPPVQQGDRLRRLNPDLRRLRPGLRAAPGGAVHPRQRLLRDPRCRPRGGRLRRPLPGTYAAGIYDRAVSQARAARSRTRTW